MKRQNKTADKPGNATWGDKSKYIVAKKERLKRYLDRIKQYKQNKITKKKFYQQVDRECTKTDQQLDEKEEKQFRSKIWEHKEYNRKAQWTNNVKKRIAMTRSDPCSEHILRIAQSNTQKRIPRRSRKGTLPSNYWPITCLPLDRAWHKVIDPKVD